MISILFFPLDVIKDWNKIYGSNGFTQYQVIFPQKSSYKAIKIMLEKISKSGKGSFLAVLKLYGEENKNYLSFPMQGYSLALDFKLEKGLMGLLNELDKIVIKYEGRIYLAKDARVSREVFELGYPQIEKFRKFRNENLLIDKLNSLQSKELVYKNKIILVIGGNSDVGKSIANSFANLGCNILVTSRKNGQLFKFTKHIEERYNVKCNELFLDITDFESHQTFYENIKPKPDIVVSCIGHLDNQSVSEKSFSEALLSFKVNFIGLASLLNIVSLDFEEKKEGVIIGISSVAGERGRATNYIYGSSKAALSTYLSGLRNRLYSKNIRVITVKPGFIYTKMTKHLTLPRVLTASTDEVSKHIIRGLNNAEDIIYVKPIWRYIFILIRMIPEFLFKRMNL